MFFKRAKQDKKKSSESSPDASASEAAANGSAAPEALNGRAIDPKSLGFETTAEVEPAEARSGRRARWSSWPSAPA